MKANQVFRLLRIYFRYALDLFKINRNGLDLASSSNCLSKKVQLEMRQLLTIIILVSHLTVSAQSI